MLDRVTGMQVLARAAALGNLSAAARALGMSQTMATKHIAAIEQRLGVKLLHRTTRRLTLTEAGRRYLDAVERILAELAEADAAVAAEHAEVQGTLRLNAPVSFGIREIAPLLPEFLRLHPALKIDLGLNDRLVSLVDEGWDAAVRIGDLAESTLVARRIAPCRTALCAAPSYLAARAAPRTVAELGEHNCLGYTLSRVAGADRWYFGRRGTVAGPIAGDLRANNGDALVAAAVAGHGVIYQPTFLVGAELKAQRLVAIELDHPALEIGGIFVVYPSDRRPPAKVRAFIDFLVEKFGPVPPWDRGLRL